MRRRVAPINIKLFSVVLSNDFESTSGVPLWLVLLQMMRGKSIFPAIHKTRTYFKASYKSLALAFDSLVLTNGKGATPPPKRPKTSYLTFHKKLGVKMRLLCGTATTKSHNNENSENASTVGKFCISWFTM